MLEKYLKDFISSHVIYKHSDLWIKTKGVPDSDAVLKYLKEIYLEMENYINRDKVFLSTLHGHHVDTTAPELIRQMARFSREADVGPMAGVAGAFAEAVGRRLLLLHDEVICNNGGDIFYKTSGEQQFILNATGSPFHKKIMINVPATQSGKGLCTSSGISGHSINMGRTYAVTILADNACRADVWATAVSNQIVTNQDIEKGLKICQEKNGIEGVIILVDKYLGVWGNVNLSRIE